MTTLFYDIIHKEKEVDGYNILVKSKRSNNHLTDLKKLFKRLKRYNLKLNPEKCAFWVFCQKITKVSLSKTKHYLLNPPILVNCSYDWTK